MRQPIAVLIVLFASLVPVASSQGNPRPVLVELFTSEGCSSCPPADALLKRLNGLTTDSGQLIVAVSEHVTYWNQLGWADPFSQETYTSRQNAYGTRFHLDSVYTPQIVVNGEREVLGSDRAAVLKAVAATGKPTPASLHLDNVLSQADGRDRNIAFTYSWSGLSGRDLDLYAAITDDMASSSVSRGENAGRTLSHVSVARSLTKIANLHAEGTAEFRLPDPTRIPGQPPTGRHLILFAQERGSGNVVAVEAKAL